MIKAGDLVKSISIEYLAAGSPSQDAGGAPEDVWTTLYSTRAAIRPLRGRELFQAQQISSEVTGTIQIRFRNDKSVTSKMRANYQGRYYDILAVVDPDEKHEELLLYVREGPNNG